MKCVYVYKNHTFDSEIQLNDFLLGKQKYQSKYGDIVFSMTERATHAYDLLMRANEEADKATKEKMLWKKAVKSIVDEEVLEKFPPPYEGVNAFLSGRRNEEGVLFNPEFIRENYWSERFKKWAEGDFTDGKGNPNEAEVDEYDIDLSKPVKIPLSSNFTKFQRGECTFEEAMTPQQKQMVEAMEHRWEQQARYGDVIHAIGEFYFSKVKTGQNKGRYWFEMLDKVPDLFYKQLMNKKIPNIDWLTNDQIKQTVQYFTQLKTTLRTMFGKDCEFVPETSIIADIDDKEGKVNKLLGRLDLTIIDKDGNHHIVDYKTSPRTYQQFPSAKKGAFKYQLATYARMLEQKGANKYELRQFVAPIQMYQFRKDPANKGKYIFSEVKSDSVINELTSEIQSERIQDNLDEFIPITTKLSASAEKMQETVADTMGKWFPEYGKERTDDEIKEMMEKAGAFKRRSDLAHPYVYQPKYNPNFAVYADTPEELFRKVKDDYNKAKEYGRKGVAAIRSILIDAIKEGTSDMKWPESTREHNSLYIKKIMSEYCNDNWEVLKDDPAYEAAFSFGIMLVRNKVTGAVDVIKISNRNLYYNPMTNGNKNLTAAFESDSVENSKPDTLILQGATGNIELMECMNVLNNMKFSSPLKIRSIFVVNPKQANGMPASNEELLYSFNAMRRVTGDKSENQFENGNLRLASKPQTALFKFMDIMSRIKDSHSSTSNTFRNYKTAVSALDNGIAAGNRLELRTQFEELERNLRKDFNIHEVDSILDKGDSRDAYDVYAQVELALADLNGLTYRQQLRDHDKATPLTRIPKEGWYMQAIENPGNYASDALNSITRLAEEAYQNVRDKEHAEFRTISMMIEGLKEDAGYGKAQEYTFGNQSKLYKGMIVKTKDDLMFVNPLAEDCTLSAKQKEFLLYAIQRINEDRYGKSKDEVIKLLKINDYDTLKVPLMRGNNESRLASQNYLSVFKGRLQRMVHPEYWRDKASDFLNSEEEQLYKKAEDIFEMNNTMDAGNGERRRDIYANCTAKDPDYFETDVERILMHHIMAYSVQKEMEKKMPLMKAASIALTAMGEFENQPFTNDLKTMNEVIRHKIKNESLIEDNMKVTAAITDDIKRVASFMALGFAPVQATYQALDGVFKAIKLTLMKPDGKQTFTREHFMKAFEIVYRDLGHFSEIPTLCAALNQVYGINDMDINQYAEMLRNDKHGMFHFFDRIAYKFASRPDFYNRMAIFLCQLMEDGALEAHSVDSKGRLVYDCTKDKRYEAFMYDDKSDMEEYNKSKARYIAAARKFVEEGARNADGSLFVFDIKNKPKLPRAYTSREAQSKKDVSDSLFGYYDHTKKSMFLGKYLGSLFGQMRTYWSAKKNQYLRPGGKGVQGHWEQKKDADGNLLYYGLKEDGSLDYNGPLTKDSKSGIPFYQWAGDWQEGILVTLWNMGSDLIFHSKENGGIVNTFKSDWWNNADESKRRAYRANIMAFAYDITGTIVFSIICALLNELRNDANKEARDTNELSDAAIASAANFTYMTMLNAGSDFKPWSLVDFMTDWNPFAVTSMVNIARQGIGVMTGDKNVFSALGNSFGFGRQFKPMFQYLARNTNLTDDDQ